MSRTPSPWKWHNENGVRRLRGANGRPVMDCGACPGDANKFVIEAAPVLLEACEAIVQAVQFGNAADVALAATLAQAAIEQARPK